MPLSSPYPPISIPSVDIWSLLFSPPVRQGISRPPFPGSKAIFTDAETARSYTFADLRTAALEFGQGLKARWAWKKGQVLAFYTPNSIDTPALTLGCLWAGGVVCPANPLSTPDELAHQLRDSGASALATQLAQLPAAREAARKAGIPENRIILLGDLQDPQGKFRHFTAVRSTAYTGRYAKTTVDAKKDAAFLVYSSGTTGLPKGVCLSHYNIVANILQMASVEGLYFHPFGGVDGMGTKALGVTPFFHIYGLTCCLFTSIWLGWELIVLSRFDLEKACQAIQKYGITYGYVPPPIILAVGKHPIVDTYDLTTLRLLHSGAAPLTRELAEAVWDRLKIPVKQGYGLSETAPAAHVQTPDEWGKFMGSVGKLLPNMEAKIVDLEGKEVAEGEDGELWLKGPNVFQGYLNLPDKTADAFASDGFFKTGDIFRVDKYGNYYCVDRLKELIKYKGFQVAPAELEGLLLGHEHILDTCVVGIEDAANATEVPRAYVVLRSDQQPDEAKAEEIVAWAAKRSAPYKKLRGGVHFINEVPKSQSGKILRRVLKDLIKQQERKSGARL